MAAFAALWTPEPGAPPRPQRDIPGARASHWGELIRELAHYDVSRYGEVLDWPLPEALLALEALMRARAEERYQRMLMGWNGLGSPPPPPAILRGA
ncbi:MAG: hypothetical protein Q8R97_04575 [Brevundimonas sp.]|nr:hypothetical protein [Brevundimonas sp.]